MWNKYKEEEYIRLILKNRHLFNFEFSYYKNGNISQSFSGTYEEVLDFIEKAKTIHKDNYDYNNTNYINKRTKVTITCKIHGLLIRRLNENKPYPKGESP